jgi:hypothetical protein
MRVFEMYDEDGGRRTYVLANTMERGVKIFKERNLMEPERVIEVGADYDLLMDTMTLVRTVNYAEDEGYPDILSRDKDGLREDV